MLQSVVTKIMVGPDPAPASAEHTRSPHVAHALTGTHGVALRAYPKNVSPVRKLHLRSPKNVHQPWPLALMS